MPAGPLSRKTRRRNPDRRTAHRRRRRCRSCRATASTRRRVTARAPCSSNVLYVPAKLVYAVLGGLVGGGTDPANGGQRRAADPVSRSSLGGGYVVTPEMIAGKEPIHFSGPTDTAPGCRPTAPPPCSR